MKADEVHKIMIKVLGPKMKEMGFKRTKSSTAGWFIPYKGKLIFIKIRLSWTGYDVQYGNCLVIDAGLSNSERLSDFIEFDRPLYDLNEGQKQKLLAVQNKAREIIPALGPARRFNDCCDYYNAEHIEAYAHIFCEFMPTILENYKKNLEKQGLL